MRDEQMLALTLLGLMLWNLAAYATSFPPASSTPPPSTPSPGGGSFWDQFIALFAPFSCTLQNLWGLPRAGCQASQPAGDNSAGGPALLQPSPLFFPVLIMTIAAYLNALWMALSVLSMRAHGRFETDEAMGIAALQAALPIAIPIIILMQLLEGRYPSMDEGRPVGRSMEA